eukprot:9050505-Pyramimonas_sp.AAC.1
MCSGTTAGEPHSHPLHGGAPSQPLGGGAMRAGSAAAGGEARTYYVGVTPGKHTASHLIMPASLRGSIPRHI